MIRIKRLLVALVAASLFVPAVPAAAATETTIIDGLAQPLGLAVANGTVYVTEAAGGRLIAVDDSGNDSVLVDSGIELAGVAVTGRGKLVYTSTTYNEDFTVADAAVTRFRVKGSSSQVLTSTLDYEVARNPDGGQSYGFLDGASDACLDEFAGIGIPPVYQGIVETHPYAVAKSGGSYVVADAAANALLSVTNRGRVSTLAVLPPVAQVIDQDTADAFGLPSCVGETFHGEPVPTDVELGPDGHLYVSLLPGAPEVAGTGEIWRVHRNTGAMTKVTSGLVSPVDIAVAQDGTIYVAELFASRISTVAGGVVSHFADVPMPGAIEITPKGALYATTDVFGNGSVVKLTN